MTTSPRFGAQQDQLMEWQRLVEIMPASVKTAIPLGFRDRARLYALDLPIREVPIEGLR